MKQNHYIRHYTIFIVEKVTQKANLKHRETFPGRGVMFTPLFTSIAES